MKSCASCRARQRCAPCGSVSSTHLLDRRGRPVNRYVEGRRNEELDHLILDEGLDPDATRAFIEGAFRNGAVPTAGAAVTAILPPTSRFGESDLYGIKKQTVLDRLAAFFDRYYALG